MTNIHCYPSRVSQNILPHISSNKGLLQSAAAAALFLHAPLAEAACLQSMVAAFPVLRAPSVVAHGSRGDRR